MEARADKPESANGLRKVLRAVLQNAVKEKLRSDDPTRDVKKIKSNSDGFHSWEEEGIAQFRATHPIGSKARLAFELLLNTGQRRGDVIGMGRQQLRGGYIHVRQQKTGAKLAIPVLAPLQAMGDATPAKNMTFITTEFDRPFTAPGFGKQVS